MIGLSLSLTNAALRRGGGGYTPPVLTMQNTPASSSAPVSSVQGMVAAMNALDARLIELEQ